MAVVANLTVNIGAKTSEFEKAMGGLERSWAKTGAKLKSAGADLTKAITLPLAAIAVGSVKMASDFETAMTKVRTLASESQANIEGLRQKVLALAPTVGIGPTALADALLVIESTGFRGAEAMDILEMSAKGSAIGMGATSDIARALTATINAYGKENITAAQAADMLTATVDAGGAEANELAGEIGRVVGVAAQLGVGFDQVGAFIATYTKLGLSAAEATTGLSGALNMILNPSREARNALADIGMSAEGLRVAVRDQGLDEALIGLLDKVRGNGDAVGALFGNVRALAGVMGTAGSQAKTYREVLEQIQQSAGTLNERFKIWRETTAATWAGFTAQVQVAAIELGAKLAPAFSQVLQSAAPLLDAVVALIQWFGSLPQPVQTTAIGLAAVAAAIGPVTYAFGTLLTTGSSLITAFRLLPFAAVSSAVHPMAAAMSGAATETGLLAAAGATLSGVLTTLTPVAIAAGAVFAGYSFSVWLEGVDSLSEGFKKLGASFLDATHLVPGATAAYQAMLDAKHRGPVAVEAARMISPAGAEMGEHTHLAEQTAAMRKLEEANRAAAAAAEEHAKKLKHLVDELSGTATIAAANEMAEAFARTGRSFNEIAPEMRDRVTDTISAAVDVLTRRHAEIPDAYRRILDASRYAIVTGNTAIMDASLQGMRDYIGLSAQFMRTQVLEVLPVLSSSNPVSFSTGMLAAPAALNSTNTTQLREEIDQLERLKAIRKDRIADGLRDLGQGFESLGSAVGGTFGGIVSGIGGIVNAFSEIKRTGAQSQTAMANFAAAAQGAAAVWQATGGDQSAGKAALSGALSGAMAGMNPGLVAATSGGSIAVGAAVGAFVGAWRASGGPSAEELLAAKDAAEDWGDAIVAEFERVGNIGSQLKAGDDRRLQVLYALQDAYRDIGRTAGEAWNDVFALHKAETIGAEATQRALDNINEKLAEHQKMLKDWAEGVAQFNDGFATRVEGFTDSMGRLEVATDDNAASFERMGQYAIMAFAQTLQQTNSVMAAVDAIRGPMGQLTELEKQFGFEGSAAFARLADVTAIVDANSDIFHSLEGLNQMMAGLQTATLFTHADLELFGQDTTSLFNDLVLRGIDANTAMALMQPTLQSLWEGQKKFGDFTDEGTLALLHQAEVAGLVGENQTSVMEQLLKVLTQVDTTLQALPQLLRDAGAAADAAFRGVNITPEMYTGGTAGARNPDVASFANEGIVRRPTLAMIGDASEPEYVLHQSTVRRLTAGGTGAAGGGVQVVQHFHGTVIGNSQEFEQATTAAVRAGLEKGGMEHGRMRTIVRQMVR